MKLKLLIMLSSVLISTQVFSGLLIDPYVGVGRAASTLSASGISLTDPDPESTTSVGSRLGYSFLLLSAGIDYEMVTAGDDKLTNISAFVGVDMPILIRAWAEYFVNSQFDVDGGVDRDFKDGYGIGLGFTGLPFVSLNLEIQNLNYEFDYDATTKVDHSVTATTFSVSLPLDL